jgi:4-amino-4-deoxy-L-arabinose transferase-like glycosyltransferase
MTFRPGPQRICVEAAAVFLGALSILLSLAPAAPFTKELGVCESGAVRDVLAGNLILPHFIPGPMVHVPPLYWWSAAVAVRLLGWSELALRLPALIPAALTCAILYGWMLSRLNREAAFWAAAALLLCHFFLDAARQPRMDSMLALFVTAAAIALERGLATRRAAWMGAAAVAIGLGCLTKGILGIALPGIVVGFYLLTRRRWAELFRADVVIAFAAGLAIGLAWYIAGYEIAGAKFLRWQIGMNLVSRFVPAQAGGADYCVHPIWYFGPQIVGGFLPWSLFIPALGVAIWPRRGPMIPESMAYALCWFGGVFVLFSVSRGKCPVYILPAFPPLAALLGWLIALVCAEAPTRLSTARLFTAASLAIALCALILATAGGAILIRGVPDPLPIVLHPTDQRYLAIFSELAATHHYGVLNWIVITLLGVLVSVRGVARRLPDQTAFGVLLIALAGSRFWFGVMTPALAESETLAPFAREIMDLVPASATIGHIGIEDCDLYFYSPRPITPVFRFHCAAAGAFPPYLVIRRNRFEALPAADRTCLTAILTSDPVDSHGPRLLVEQKP